MRRTGRHDIAALAGPSAASLRAIRSQSAYLGIHLDGAAAGRAGKATAAGL